MMRTLRSQPARTMSAVSGVQAYHLPTLPQPPTIINECKNADPFVLRTLDHTCQLKCCQPL